MNTCLTMDSFVISIFRKRRPYEGVVNGDIYVEITQYQHSLRFQCFLLDTMFLLMSTLEGLLWMICTPYNAVQAH